MEASRLLSRRPVPRAAVFLLALKEADLEAFTSEVGSVVTVSEPVNTQSWFSGARAYRVGRGKNPITPIPQTHN